jgi:superfamily II DNA/RNA helicase
MACAQTGSGKTASFLFPIIAMLLKTPPPESTFNFNRRKVNPLALILGNVTIKKFVTYKG